MDKPLRLAISFREPRDGVLEVGFSLAYEPVPVVSSVAPSGLCSTESEGNPEELFATLGLLDGIEFPMEKKILKVGSLVNSKGLKLSIFSIQFISCRYIQFL